MGESRQHGQSIGVDSAYRSAILYFTPSFSNSAITQSVTHGIPAGPEKCERPFLTDEDVIEVAYTLRKVHPSCSLSAPFGSAS